MYMKLVKDMLINKPSYELSRKKNIRERGIVTDKEIQHKEKMIVAQILEKYV